MTVAVHCPLLNLILNAIACLLLLVQLPAGAILLARLLQGARRTPPLRPRVTTPDQIGQVSIIVPTLNEAERIAPCLEGLSRQGYEVREILIVDSRSQDGTVDRVKVAQAKDPRIRLMTDDPLPTGWVGRPWALHTGFLHSSPHSQWILGIDADTRPKPGLVASLIHQAEQTGYDLISLAPQFIMKDWAELLLQPALLITLLYRFGAAGNTATADRVMANGQCFLCRRSLLVQLDGYTSARQSFCDDVTLARYAARQGANVAFLDGANLIQVRMYEGAIETWHEWGRSLDLKDAASVGQTWGDVAFLATIQALPILLTPFLLLCSTIGQTGLPLTIVLNLNLSLLLIRCALLLALRPSYDLSSITLPWSFWLSPLADPIAVYRIFLSARQRPKRWRGREYEG